MNLRYTGRAHSIEGVRDNEKMIDEKGQNSRFLVLVGADILLELVYQRK